MNSLVCIAYVPDTETRIRIGPDGKSIDESDVKWIVSPYDGSKAREVLVDDRYLDDMEAEGL